MALAVGAVVLVAGYVVPRLGSDPGAAPSVDADVVLACVPAVAPACREVAGDLGVATIAWTPGEPVPASAVVVAPGPDLPAGVGSGEVMARSPVVIAVWLERLPLLAEACGGAVDFGCVAGNAGAAWTEIGGPETWGTFTIGLAEPGAGEAELLSWWAVQEAGPSPRLDAGLRLTASSDARLAEDFVLFGASRADAIVVSEVAVAPQLGNAPLRGGRIEIVYPGEQPWVDYLATPTSRQADELAEVLFTADVQDRLAAHGLRPVSGDLAGLPDGLGEPGREQAAPGPEDRATLVETWDGR